MSFGPFSVIVDIHRPSWYRVVRSLQAVDAIKHKLAPSKNTNKKKKKNTHQGPEDAFGPFPTVAGIHLTPWNRVLCSLETIYAIKLKSASKKKTERKKKYTYRSADRALLSLLGGLVVVTHHMFLRLHIGHTARSSTSTTTKAAILLLLFNDYHLQVYYVLLSPPQHPKWFEATGTIFILFFMLDRKSVV